jgi:hypothetical protein
MRDSLVEYHWKRTRRTPPQGHLCYCRVEQVLDRFYECSCPLGKVTTVLSVCMQSKQQQADMRPWKSP